MRIGLYGLPTSGKSFLLANVGCFDVLAGSQMLLKIDPNFHNSSEDKKREVRNELANVLLAKDDFIMDGHYSFGDEVVFTDSDGELYDAILYLYVNPDILKRRMMDSERNREYLQFDLKQWQNFEIKSLREYCHKYDKDFYVIDNPENGCFEDISVVLQFLDCLKSGFSCISYAQEVAKRIHEVSGEDVVYLADGDKTLILEDSSSFIGYTTHLFDGNFYTGFQSWRHHNEMKRYIYDAKIECPKIDDLIITYNEKCINFQKHICVLTTGYLEVWQQISTKLKTPLFGGIQMSADTKYFITKFIQRTGHKVCAYGDSMNDYFMLKQADEGYLVRKEDGTVSKSLKGMDLEGLKNV